MNIKIKKLMPEHVEEYIHFFDTTPHDDLDPTNTCYCVSWCSDDHRGMTEYPSREERPWQQNMYMRKDSGVSGLCGWKAFRLVQCQYKI